jgi:mutator family transposase
MWVGHRVRLCENRFKELTKGNTTMALSQSALLDLVTELKNSDASELMRRMLAMMLQELIDAEASGVIGALPHKRTDARTTQRNGTEQCLRPVDRPGGCTFPVIIWSLKQ